MFNMFTDSDNQPVRVPLGKIDDLVTFNVDRVRWPVLLPTLSSRITSGDNTSLICGFADTYETSHSCGPMSLMRCNCGADWRHSSRASCRAPSKAT